MKSIQKVIVQLLFFGIGFSSLAQNAKLRGIILDENKQAVAHVFVSNGEVGTQSNSNGFYELTIPSNKKVTVVFSHVALKTSSIVLFLKSNENFEFNPVMNTRQDLTIGKSGHIDHYRFAFLHFLFLSEKPADAAELSKPAQCRKRGI